MLKVLIVKDELMIADLLEETLVDAGYVVCGSASTMATAIVLGERHQPDLGVIDLHLSGGECGTKIAAALRRRGGFGVLYATGNPNHALLEDAEGEACITKPYRGTNVVSALRVVSEILFNRPLSTFPQGFRLLGTTSASIPSSRPALGRPPRASAVQEAAQLHQCRAPAHSVLDSASTALRSTDRAAYSSSGHNGAS